MRFGLDNPEGEEKTQKEVADYLGISQSFVKINPMVRDREPWGLYA